MPGGRSKRGAAAHGGNCNRGGSTGYPTRTQPEPDDGPIKKACGRSGSVVETRSTSRPSNQVRRSTQYVAMLASSSNNAVPHLDVAVIQTAV